MNGPARCARACRRNSATEAAATPSRAVLTTDTAAKTCAAAPPTAGTPTVWWDEPGDGVYGLGGISMSVRAPREAMYVEADASDFELYYYQQPGGGALQLYDNGLPVDRVSTDGEPSPAYYHLEAMPGPHRLELETLDRAPVRLFGWVAEKPAGVTYETLGINGAQASIVLDWNEETLRSNIERRNPAMIVLAYGTNEAGRKDPARWSRIAICSRN